jgi:hypothetical protein
MLSMVTGAARGGFLPYLGLAVWALANRIYASHITVQFGTWQMGWKQNKRRPGDGSDPKDQKGQACIQEGR